MHPSTLKPKALAAIFQQVEILDKCCLNLFFRDGVLFPSPLFFLARGAFWQICVVVIQLKVC